MDVRHPHVITSVTIALCLQQTNIEVNDVCKIAKNTFGKNVYSIQVHISLLSAMLAAVYITKLYEFTTNRLTSEIYQSINAVIIDTFVTQVIIPREGKTKL